MEQTKRIRIRTVSLLFVLLTVAQWVYAQGARQHAWTVLNTGLADKNSGERAIAVGVLGLLINDPQAPELAMQALADPKPEVIAAAADALGQLNYQAASPKLREILHSDEENPLIVLACARARTGGRRGVCSLLRHSHRRTEERIIADREAEEGDQGSEELVLVANAASLLPQRWRKQMTQMGMTFVPFAGMGYGALKAFTKDDASPVQAEAAKMLIKDTDPKSEQALINASKHKSYLALFRGAFGAFKNPLSHRSVGHDDPVRVFELLAFASLLMRSIDDLGGV